MSNRVTMDRAMVMGLTPEQRADLEAYYAGTDEYAQQARKALNIQIPRFDTDCEFVWAYLGHCRLYFEDERKESGVGNVRSALSDLDILIRAVGKVRGMIVAQNDLGLKFGKSNPEIPIKDRLEKTILKKEEDAE